MRHTPIEAVPYTDGYTNPAPIAPPIDVPHYLLFASLGGSMAPKLVSLREAAARLTAGGDKIEKSTLSRYVAAHSAALKPTRSGKVLLVDVERLAAHRRSFLGKGPAIKKDAARREAFPTADVLSLADEQQRKLRASRLLALDRLAQRRADLVSWIAAEWVADAAVRAMRGALRHAGTDITATVLAERGGDAEVIQSVFQGWGDQVARAMQDALRQVGYLTKTPAELREMAALVPADEPEPPEPETLDDERAAKARVDRLSQELTLMERRRVMIPRREAEFALLDALERAKQALATAARDGVEALARAAGVEPVFVRPYPRQLERRVLALFGTQASSRRGDLSCRPS